MAYYKGLNSKTKDKNVDKLLINSINKFNPQSLFPTSSSRAYLTHDLLFLVSTSSSRAYLTRDLLCPFQLVTSHLMRGLLNFAQSQIKEMPCQARQDRLCFNSMFVLAGGEPRPPITGPCHIYGDLGSSPRRRALLFKSSLQVKPEETSVAV